ncbi:MAG: DUF3667 domain-containing protein [Saprospiraceae bacterium]|jgi:hypothetical protein|nr:DUF3667 domain-containing protein [Saprospiraceae bacterium]
MHLPELNPPENCPSCGATFKGKYCHKCGEKRVSAKDFHLRKYAQTLAEHFTHFDSKALRSLRALVSKPGFLTAEFVAGRRNLYLKPLQLFLLLNLAFFLFFGDNDVFSPKLKWVYHSESESKIWSGERLKDLTDAYAAREQIAVETAIKTIDAKSAGLTKVLLYLFVPLLGTLFFALFFRQNPYFLCHLIFATHWFAFLLLLLMVGGTLIVLLFQIKGMVLLTAFLVLLLPVHLFATRYFYGGHWAWLALKTLVFFAGFSVLYLLYRDFILFLTLRLLLDFPGL